MAHPLGGHRLDRRDARAGARLCTRRHPVAAGPAAAAARAGGAARRDHALRERHRQAGGRESMRIALRRAATSHRFVWLVVLVAGAAVAGPALTGFSAETRGQATYAGGWLSPPSALQTPSPLGYGARRNWTAGTHGMSGGGATQALLGSQFSSNPTSCTSATYTDFSTTSLSATLATTWDNRGSTLNGYWICYRLESRRATWSSGANFSIVQIGLVPAGIAPANGGSIANTTENNDTITLTFNQPITNTGAASINVCVYGGGSGTSSIEIGPSSSSC